MQRLSETLIHRTPELDTAQPPGDSRAMGVALLGNNFADHLYSMARELPSELGGELSHSLAGISLPSAGNTLPVTPDEQPRRPSLVDGLFDTTQPSAEFGESDRIPLELVDDTIAAGIITAISDPAVSPLDLDTREYTRNPVAAVEIVDGLSRQQIPVAKPSVPVILRHENSRVTDNSSQNHHDAPKSVNSDIHANRFVREVTHLKMPTEVQGAKPSLSFAPPPLTAAAFSLNGTSSAPVLPAMTLVTAVDTPVLDPAWADALQDRILWLAGKNIQAAEVRLNPAELGPLRVQISVDEHSTHVAFSATHAVTRDALEMALPRLKEMLAENGILLSDASVSDQGIANQRNDSNRGEQADIAPGDEDAIQAVTDLLPTRVTTKSPSGLVDTYV